MAVSHQPNKPHPFQAKARIRHLRKEIHIGYFDTYAEAREAVDAWHQRRYGTRREWNDRKTTD